jgi:hypothetical protein
VISRDPDEALRALTSSRQRCEEPAANDCRGPADLEKLHYDDETDTWYECMFDQRHDQYTWVIIPAPDDKGSRPTPCETDSGVPPVPESEAKPSNGLF